MRKSNNYYTKGRNAWGKKAKTELIVVQNECFFEQIDYAINKLIEYKKMEKDIEFTFDYRNLTRETVKTFDFVLILRLSQIA